MKIKDKIDKRLNESSTWILDSPQSLSILMIMGTGMAFLFFGVFSAAFGFRTNWFLMGLFGIFSLLSLKQFIKILTMVKQLGLKNALGGICAREFVWKKGGEEDGNSRYQGDEVCSERDAEKNKRIRKEVGHIYR